MVEVDQNILVEALTEAMDTMAFMVVMPPEDELLVPDEAVLVRIKYSGPSNGTIELVAGMETIQMIAANVMGIDPDDPEACEKGVDAFKEVSNTTCGVLLPILDKLPEDVFDMTVPESEIFEDAEKWNEYVNMPDTIIVDVDGFPMAARWTVE